jgi:hypothetical protein
VLKSISRLDFRELFDKMTKVTRGWRLVSEGGGNSGLLSSTLSMICNMITAKRIQNLSHSGFCLRSDYPPHGQGCRKRRCAPATKPVDSRLYRLAKAFWRRRYERGHRRQKFTVKSLLQCRVALYQMMISAAIGDERVIAIRLLEA